MFWLFDKQENKQKPLEKMSLHYFLVSSLCARLVYFSVKRGFHTTCKILKNDKKKKNPKNVFVGGTCT